MSAGHDHQEWAALDWSTVERILRQEDIHAFLNRAWREDSSTQVPYVGGTDEACERVLYDIDLPEEIEARQEGYRRLIRPRPYVREHEIGERAMIEVAGWPYARAHAFGNALEKRKVLADGIPWLVYEPIFTPYIRVDARKPLDNVAPDLYLGPYLAPPVNRNLLARMYKAMGARKLPKADPQVRYSDHRGKPGRHCGPTDDWPHGFCSMYGNFDCSKVEGEIMPKGGCDLYEKAKEV